MSDDIEKKWTKVASDLLLNRKIVGVKYISKSEAKSLGWYGRSLSITLDSGLVVYASQDDEGNGPGALFTTAEKASVLPVL
jgi:hypothetical protein